MTLTDQQQREADCKAKGHQVMHHRNRKICSCCGKTFAGDIPDSVINSPDPAESPTTADKCACGLEKKPSWLHSRFCIYAQASSKPTNR